MADNDKQIKELFDTKVHLGHKKNRIHPKAKKYIYTMDNGVSIIDLTKTAELLDKAEKYITSLSKEEKKLLVVATKRIASSAIEKFCKENNISYVTSKWPAGLLTNFETVRKNVKKMEDMKKAKEEKQWDKLVKHEQSALGKELIKLERFYGGLSDLKKMPDALFIVDIKKEKNALAEARNFNLSIIAIVDTNVDPSLVNFPIPGNDDSFSSVDCLFKKAMAGYITEKSKTPALPAGRQKPNEKSV